MARIADPGLAITCIEAFHVRSDEDGAVAMPAGCWMRVLTSEGIAGLGATPAATPGRAFAAVAEALRPLLLGRNALDHQVLRARMTEAAARLGPEAARSAALSAIDIALWDIKGQALGQPIYRLLGGAARDALPFCAAIDCNSGRSLTDVVRAVDDAMEAGPALIKLRAGAHGRRDADLAGDIAKARAVRRHLGPEARLAFDGGGGYSVAGAIAVGRAMEECGYEWIEEPVQHCHVSALREVVENLDIAVAAGQLACSLQELRQLADCGVRILQPDITRMGGFTGLKQAAALADAYDLELLPHQAQPVIGHTANLHLTATLPVAGYPCQVEDWTGRRAAVFREAPCLHDGRWHLPEAPGLGLALDEHELARRREDLG